MYDDERFYWWVNFASALLLAAIVMAVMGCTVPHNGYVLDHMAGKYNEITCETYSRTPIQRDILLCEVQP